MSPGTTRCDGRYAEPKRLANGYPISHRAEKAVSLLMGRSTEPFDGLSPKDGVGIHLVQSHGHGEAGIP